MGQIHLENFANAGSTGEVVVATPNFQTQAYLFLNGTNSSGARVGVANHIGLGTAADQFMCGCRSEEAANPPDSVSRAIDTAMDTFFHAVSPNFEVATLDSMTATELKFDFSVANSGYNTAFLCFGGLSETPDVREITIGGNGTQTIDLGWGGAPDLILGTSSWTTATAGSGDEDHGHLGFYASTWDGASEAAGGVFTASENDPDGDGSSANSDTQRAMSEGTWLINSRATSGRDTSFNVEIVHDPAVATAGKYQVITTNHAGEGTCHIYLMALRGLRAQFVSEDAPTVQDVAHPVTGAGFRPTHVMNWNIEHESNTTQNHGGFSLYMADATNQYGMWMRDKHDAAGAATERRWESGRFCRAEDQSTSNNRYLSGLDSLDADGHTETPTKVNTAIKRGFLYMVGESADCQLPILGVG